MPSVRLLGHTLPSIMPQPAATAELILLLAGCNTLEIEDIEDMKRSPKIHALRAQVRWHDLDGPGTAQTQKTFFHAPFMCIFLFRV